MEPAVPASAPEPYREPRTGFGALVRNRIVRRTALFVAGLGILVAIDQSFVQTRSAPVCGRCCARFDETTWTLDVPILELNHSVTEKRTARGAWPAAALVSANHQHSLQVHGTEETRGVLLRRECGGIVCCLYDTFPGAFSRALDGERGFADFVAAAIERGDVSRDDVAAAIELLHRFSDEDAPPPGEQRLRDVANGLYAAWLGRPVAETDLWNAHE